MLGSGCITKHSGGGRVHKFDQNQLIIGGPPTERGRFSKNVADIFWEGHW